MNFRRRIADGKGWRRTAIVLLFALQACALKPAPSREAIQMQVLANAAVPEQWRAAGAAPGDVESGWLATFGDPQLEALVAEALAFNADLRAAAARVERAAAYIKVAGGELYPAVSASGRAGANADGSGLQGVLVSAAWEIDVWGRIRYGVRSSKDQHAAMQADFAFARQSLAALVAKSWFLATEASLQHDLMSEMLAAAAQLLQFAENRRRIGIGNDFDVAVSQVNFQAYRDSLQQVTLAREQALRSLELLLGRYPAAEIVAVNRLPVLGSSVPAGLPAQLLERRPDVIAAERRVSALFNSTQQARAARLPRISLTGSGTDFSSDLFVLQDQDNPVWRAGGAVLAPLFTGGALRAQVAVKTAEQHEAMAAYAQTALAAFGDVENALAGEFSMREREAILAAAVLDAERALQLAQTRYRVGSGDLRDVERQQLSYRSARMSLLRVQSERRIGRVNLHLALGGDFAASS